MASRARPDTDQLLTAASQGDRGARGRLLQRHRRRLRRMVAVRLDPRLAPRVDPSDIVQEALGDADRRLDDYLRRRPIAFYPWLRRLTWDRLADAYHRHLRAGQRSVSREEPPPLPGASSAALAERLLDDPSDRPGAGLSRAERQVRVRAALDQLADHVERLERPHGQRAVKVAERLEEGLVELVRLRLGVPLSVLEEQVARLRNSEPARLAGKYRVTGRKFGEPAERGRAILSALGEPDLLLAELDVPGVVEAAVERLLSHGDPSSTRVTAEGRVD